MRLQNRHARRVLRYQDRHEAVLRAVEKMAQKEPIDNERLNMVLQLGFANAEKLNGVFKEVLPPEFFTQRQPSALATKVFAVPELLEKILQNLAIHQLLRAMAVSKQFHQAISSSVKLQRLLGLESYNDSNFRCIVQEYRWRGLHVNFDELVSVPPWKENKAQLAITCDGSLTVGKRARAMQLCSPPLTSAAASTSCCQYSWRHYHDTVPISDPCGITLGFMLDKTKQLIGVHRNCPNAAAFQHDAHGNVKVIVTFRAEIVLSDEDPLHALHQKRLSKEKARYEERRLMQAYIVAKQAGECFLLPLEATDRS